MSHHSVCDDVFKTGHIKCVSQNYKYHAKFRFRFEWFNVKKNGAIHTMGIFKCIISILFHFFFINNLKNFYIIIYIYNSNKI